MADEMEDGIFWLPQDFLTDDDLLMDFKTQKSTRADEFGYGSLSSPVESVTESNESDEDDYLTGLARKLALISVHDSDFSLERSKGWGISGSPQSTLCSSYMGACGCDHHHRKEAAPLVSPPHVRRKEAETLDLLYAAAEEVARMRMLEEASGLYYNNNMKLNRNNNVEPFVPPRKPSPVQNPSQNTGFYSSQNQLAYQQLQAAQFQQLKQLQMLRQQQQQQRSSIWGQAKTGYPQMVQDSRRSAASLAAWPTLQQSQQQQQQRGSGMRAVFLGDAGVKKERSGTGVFLPRGVGTQPETKKKQGCSTVLLPDRVVQALNLNLEPVNAKPKPQPQHQSRGNLNFTVDCDAALKYRKLGSIAQQSRNQRPQPVTTQELCLPQEWSY